MFLSEACKPRQSVFNRDRRDVVLDISDLFESKIDGEAFFEENFITSGMKVLIEKSFERLEGRGDQASTFLLAQAMGGGKTHNMIALGLLAKDPSLRKQVLGNDGPGSVLGGVRVVGFNGRQSDAPFGIWGEIADQLGKKDVFSDCYSPLQAPGQNAWINLLKGEPTIILLDELPPYLDNAKSKEIGNSDLSVVTTTAIANLLVAVNKKELSNVCVVISDLRASYHSGSGQINKALDNLKDETNRSALPIEPVSSHGDEIYHILRTRLFEDIADDETIKSVANEYAKAVKDAKEMDVTNVSPDSYSAQIIESYPFHFSIHDLYARFKENPGFQQTRGLIRLMRMIVSDIFESKHAEKIKLIHPYDLDLNNDEIFSEIKGINPTLDTAITHDIAKEGHSVAEELDKKFGTTDAQDVAKLILVASLANIPGATHGLRENEIIGFLCSPNRDISQVKKEVVDYLPTQAWYLHQSQDGRLFFKNTQNLAAKLHSMANSYNEQSCIKELRAYLNDLFSLSLKDCYQKLEILPAIDEINIEMEKVSLIITEPTNLPTKSKLSETWDLFANDKEFKNRMIFLTGSHETLESVKDQARQFKAIQSIIAEFESERLSPKDFQMITAQNSLDKIQLNFRSAIQETFTTLVYPSKNGLRSTDCRINFQDNYFDGENLIRETLKKIQKFTDDISSETFRKKCEARLFGGQQVSPWNEIKRRAAINPEWQFHRADALNHLKKTAVEKDIWKEEGNLVNKGPFPPPETTLNIQILNRNRDTGEATLKITPIYGDKVNYEIGDTNPQNAASSVADAPGSYGAFKTKELKLSFKCIDSKGKHQEGPPVLWENQINLKYRVFQNSSGKWMIEFQAFPRGKISYTTDGSAPNTLGAAYVEPFAIPENCRFILAYATQDGIESPQEKIDIKQYIDEEVVVDPDKKAIWNREHKNLTYRIAFDFMENLKQFQGKAFGVSIEIKAKDGKQDIFYSAAQGFEFSGEEFEKITTHLQSTITGSQIILSVEKIVFEKGQQLLDWINKIKSQLKPGEVSQ
jgi:hypothetical protein